MANAKKDDNRVPVALVDDGAATTEPLRVSPANSRLILDVASVTDNGITGTWPTRSPRDANNEPIAMGVTDDANETPTPLRIDNRNGLLFVDLLVE